MTDQIKAGWQPITSPPDYKVKVLVRRGESGPIIARRLADDTWLNCFPVRPQDKLLTGDMTPTHWHPIPPFEEAKP